LVLLSNDARVSRPKRRVPELDQVIKVEKLKSYVSDEFDKSPAIKLLGLIGSDGLLDFGRDLARRHRPASIDWPARFGLSRLTPDAPDARTQRARRPSSDPSGMSCDSCGGSISYAEVKFCRVNSGRFGGHLYCRRCQGDLAQPA
jgi:hypothetical protein